MKFIFFFILITFFVFAQISCSKSYSVNHHLLSISGKWNIAIDSNYKGCACVSNQLQIYNGKSGDYFNFSSDSNLYVKEGNTLDTLPYHITSESTLIIAAFGTTFNGIPDTCHITNLTAHTVTITAPLQLSPAGEFGRIVYLTR